MGSYINSSLTTNERVIEEANISWWSQWGYIVVGGFFALAGIGAVLGGDGGSAAGMLLIGLIFLAVAAVRVLTTELALTNKRVIAKTGFIRRNSIELRLEKVEGFVVNQSIFGRLFNYGTVLVTGTGGIKTPIPFISHPAEFRKIVNEFIENPTHFDE